MAKSDTFGWDLLFKVTQPQIRNNEDVLICLVHWKLIHQGFKCVGVGEDTTQPTQDEMSETLPEGWNASNKYTLRYALNSKLYLLNATITEGNMIINMNRLCDSQASGTCVKTDVVKSRAGNIDRIIPSYDDVIKKVCKELIDPMLSKIPSKEMHTQTAPPAYEQADPLRCDYRRSRQNLPQRQPSLPIFNDPFGVGRSDLDPFAPAGGGMLYQPPGFGPGRIGQIDPSLPPGSVPPGARFDPLRPLGPMGPGPLGQLPPRAPDGRLPDHDHLPPPGYDDMFM